MRERVDHLLTRCGYASRSQGRDWVRGGRVTSGGVVVKSASDKVEAEGVLIDGEPVDHPGGVLVALHKPLGHVCSHGDREGPTVYSLLPERWRRRNPAVTSVGRLDRDATGLLLLTDSGEWVHRWTSPKRHVEKVYEVQVSGELRESMIARFASGELMLDDEQKPCLPARLEILGGREARLTLVEGRYHQVKRMFAEQGCVVTRLHRVRFGGVLLGELAPGCIRAVTEAEVEGTV